MQSTVREGDVFIFNRHTRVKWHNFNLNFKDK